MPWSTCFYSCIGIILFNWALADHTQQASQWLSIWHNNFCSTAIAIVAHFLSMEYDRPVKDKVEDMDQMEDADEMGDTNEMKIIDERRSPQKICDDLLTGLAFLFKDLDPKLENTF